MSKTSALCIADLRRLAVRFHGANRIGHYDVKAAMRVIRMTRVQQHRPRQMAYWREILFGGVLAPGERDNSGR